MIKARPRTTVTIVYCGYLLTGKVIAVGKRTIKFKIDGAGCRAMLLDADKTKESR